MKDLKFDYNILSNNYLLYHYVRGSHAYGTNNQDSDIDTAGIYLAPVKSILGLGRDYKEQISDNKTDNVFWELKRFLQLACVGNPNTLEALWIPERCIIYKTKIIDDLMSIRNAFISKHIFNSICGFALSQIQKARGLNKKIVNPINERKSPFDFVYTVNKQGSEPILEWLSESGLKQEFCGLVNIPHMQNIYGVYYDWGAHLKDKGITEVKCASDLFENELDNTEYPDFALNYPIRWFESVKEPLGYKGIFREDSNEICLSSVKKGEIPICLISYNKDGYSKHCADYKNYQTWLKERNETRYNSNLGHNYDSKNMMHCFRILNMGIELASTGELNIDRTNIDSDFLLDVRAHKYEYEDLLERANKKEELLKELKANNNLPDEPNYELINEFLINVRNKQTNNN